jgi:hypothetical protein
VQPRVRGHEGVVDPAARTPPVGAAAHHVLERGVDAHLEPLDRPAQRPADVHTVEGYDPAGIGRPPPDRPCRAESHREQARAVRREQRAGLEVGADPGDLVLVRGGGRRQVPRGRRRLDRHPAEHGTLSA